MSGPFVFVFISLLQCCIGVWFVFLILLYYDVFYISWAQHGKQEEK